MREVNLQTEFQRESLELDWCNVDKSAMEAAEAHRTVGIPFAAGCDNERRPASCFPFDYHSLGTANVLQLVKEALLLRVLVGTPQ